MKYLLVLFSISVLAGCASPKASFSYGSLEYKPTDSQRIRPVAGTNGEKAYDSAKDGVIVSLQKSNSSIARDVSESGYELYDVKIVNSGRSSFSFSPNQNIKVLRDGRTVSYAQRPGKLYSILENALTPEKPSQSAGSSLGNSIGGLLATQQISNSTL